MARSRKNIFSKMGDWFREQVNTFRQVRTDSIALDTFMDYIEEECMDRESVFSKLNLKAGEDGQTLVFVTSVSEEVQMNGQDYLIEDKLNENTHFITEEIRRETGLHDYILRPDYFHVEDPSNDRTVSLTYLAVWRFHPLVDESAKKKVYTLFWSTLGTLAAAVAGGLLVLL